MAQRTAVIILGVCLGLVSGCGSTAAESTPTSLPALTVAPIAKPPSSPQPPTASPVPSTPRPTATSTIVPTPTEGPWRSSLPEDCPATGAAGTELTSDAPGRGVAEIFDGQIRDYLNARGSAAGLAAALGELTLLDGAWQARPQVQSVDVTGNAVPEVLVELTFFEPLQYSEGALFVYRCAGGEFAGGAVLMTAGQVLSADDPDGIRAVRDMNQDGVPEIVHSYLSIAGSHSYFTRQFHILEWDGQEFSGLIAEDQFGSAAQAENGDGAIQDRDGDGSLELVLTNGLGEAYPELGPQRARTDFWEWNGEGFVLARWEYTRPVFRIHAIWDGDDATWFGEYDRALAFYQDAVFNEQLVGWSLGRLWPDSFYGGLPTPPPDPAERDRLNAYGRYRIVLLHAVQGRRAEAQVNYGALLDLFPEAAVGDEFAELATEFWEEYAASGELGLACSKAVEFARTNRFDVLTPLGREFYGEGQRQYQPQDICPFGG